jgi:hypothetical protein
VIQKQLGSVQTSAVVGTAYGVGAGGAAVLAVSLARSSLYQQWFRRHQSLPDQQIILRLRQKLCHLFLKQIEGWVICGVVEELQLLLLQLQLLLLLQTAGVVAAVVASTVATVAIVAAAAVSAAVAAVVLVS